MTLTLRTQNLNQRTNFLYISIQERLSTIFGKLLNGRRTLFTMVYQVRSLPVEQQPDGNYDENAKQTETELGLKTLNVNDSTE